MSDTRTDRWCFTYNNPEPGWTPSYDSSKVAYMVYQKEKGDDTHTPHYQGYIRFTTRLRLAGVKKYLVAKAVHCEPSRGSEEQNRTYCTKEETRSEGPWEFGTFDVTKGVQGHRSDLDECVKAIAAGATTREIATDYPTTFVRFHKGLAEYRRVMKPPPPVSRDVSVQVLWGETGTGKSHRIKAAYPNAFIVVPGRSPFDNYDDEDVIVFEEFEWTLWPVTDMNRYLDKWLCPINCRYNNKYAMWTKVLVLANTDPGLWYANVPHELQDAFRRRLVHVNHVQTQEQEIKLI